MITVHHLERSRSHRVLWLLEELELPYELVRYTRPDGRHYDLLTNSEPIRDATGVVTGAIAAYEDVTVIENAERERTAFFAVASHELKTPLMAIRGMVQLAQAIPRSCAMGPRGIDAGAV